MIEASVFTNQDNVNCYVKKFVAIPNIGDRVAVRYKGDLMYSKVASVTHRLNSIGEPLVEIELWSENIQRLNK